MKIAIVKLSAMGDIIHAMVALQFITAAHEGLQIDWIVESGFAGVLQHNPDIQNILPVYLKALKHNKAAIFSEINRVRTYAENNYDLVIDAQGLIKSAITARLLGKKVAGFDRYSIREKAASWFYDIKIASPYDSNTIDRNVKVIAAALGVQVSSQQIQQKAAFLFFNAQAAQGLQHYFTTPDKVIVLVVGSTWPSRNYPREKFLNIANALQQRCLVVWGNEAERNTARWLAERSEYITELPKIDLNSLKAVIAHADLLIGNDTGPTHMAWALNKPSITLFGPTPVSRVYQTPINKVIKSASEVNPFKLDKNDFSINDIDENLIIKQAELLLQSHQ